MATTTNSKTCNSNVDPLNWVRTAKAMEGSHLDEVKSFVQTFFECEEVSLEGTRLTVAHVAAVARRPEVHVVLNAAAAKRRVDESSNWILESVRKGSQIPGVTTGFGAAGHRRTNQAVELQQELIRFLLAGVLQDTGNALSVCNTRAAMLVRTNTLLQGYSGLRWEILEALGKLLNHNVNPVLPLRGSITDLIPLAYIAGILTGRPDSMAITGDGKTVSAIEALNIAGIKAIELQPKEGLAMVNGTAVGSSLAAITCFDANILVILAEVMAALFCEVMQGKPGFADPLTHKLKHHPGQIEAAAIMEWVLEGSMYMKAASDPSHKPKGQDRYALRTSPQWLGPQVEAIRNATHSIQREINSMVDNPIIDAAGDRALSGGNFQGTPIGVAMDHVRLALAAIGKLIFAQFSELLNDSCNNGLPPSLNGGANPSLDFGLKGAEITMAAYLSELNYLANPVTTHAQSAEQHNQAVNSLGLISARKTEEAVHILNLMSSTFLVALCQAIDLRHVAETMQMAVKTNVDQVAEKIFTGLGLGFHPIKDDLLKVVDHQPIFTYIDDASSKTNPLMEKLKLVLLEHALQSCKIDKAKATAVFHLIDEFEDTLSARLDTVVLAVREAYDTKGLSAVRNKIEQCRSYPLYKFVRGDLQTHLLTGKSVGPGKDIEKVYIAICKGRHVAPLLRCLEGWHGAPGPSSPCRNAAASQAMNGENRPLVTDEPVAFEK